MNFDLSASAEPLPRQPREKMPREINRRMIIGMYTPSVVEYLPFDPESHRVAKWIAGSIVQTERGLSVEHIGSTAVPGCWGKGIIDLLVIYTPGCLEAAREVLDGIGFQRQSGAEAFPEARPMRVGSVAYFGRAYRIHAHVIAAGSAEARDLLMFRDLLRRNIDVRRAYEAEKRAILARGIVIGTEYSNAKGEFIRRTLAAAESDAAAGCATQNKLYLAR